MVSPAHFICRLRHHTLESLPKRISLGFVESGYGRMSMHPIILVCGVQHTPKFRLALNIPINMIRLAADVTRKYPLVHSKLCHVKRTVFWPAGLEI